MQEHPQFIGLIASRPALEVIVAIGVAKTRRGVERIYDAERQGRRRPEVLKRARVRLEHFRALAGSKGEE